LISTSEEKYQVPHEQTTPLAAEQPSMVTSGIGSPLASPWEDRQLVLFSVAGAVLAWCAVRVLEWAWWRPRRLERALRSQGLRGTAYRSLAGDAQLLVRLNKEARSRTMPLGCHDVVPRAMPLFHHAMKEHGACSRSLCFIFFLDRSTH
jgi:hypothetical protein